MKHVLAVAAFVASAGVATGVAAGNGPIDGIYRCTAVADGQQLESFLSVNGRADGLTIWTIPALSSSQRLHGYGVGQIVGNNFSGTTMYDRHFNMTISGSSLSGTMDAVLSGVPYTLNVNCNLFF